MNRKQTAQARGRYVLTWIRAGQAHKCSFPTLKRAKDMMARLDFDPDGRWMGFDPTLKDVEIRWVSPSDRSAVA
jgi:hypothetical protein